jgi:hypothetical protein
MLDNGMNSASVVFMVLMIYYGPLDNVGVTVITWMILLRNKAEPPTQEDIGIENDLKQWRRFLLRLVVLDHSQQDLETQLVDRGVLPGRAKEIVSRFFSAKSSEETR